jgi:FtsZ-interacting cell division protein ZipA
MSFRVFNPVTGQYEEQVMANVQQPVYQQPAVEQQTAYPVPQQPVYPAAAPVSPAPVAQPAEQPKQKEKKLAKKVSEMTTAEKYLNTFTTSITSSAGREVGRTITRSILGILGIKK